MELFQNRPVCVVAVMRIDQDHIGRPRMGAHEIDEPPLVEILCFISDPWQAHEQISGAGETLVRKPMNVERPDGRQEP